MQIRLLAYLVMPDFSPLFFRSFLIFDDEGLYILFRCEPDRYLRGIF